MKHVKIFEENFIKINNRNGEFRGTEPFRIDMDTGKLHRTTESNAGKNTFYLTYGEYNRLGDLNNSITEKCRLHDEQKKTTIDMFVLAIRKIIKDRPLTNSVKKYNL